MQFNSQAAKSRDPDLPIFQSLEPLIRGTGMSLVELNVFHGKGRGENASVQVRVIVYKNEIIGIDDCALVHRTILPRLELDFPGKDVYLEVSSPGIDRIIKEGSEFAHYIGRGVKCYRSDISDWTSGVLLSVDEEKIMLDAGGEEINIPLEEIAKARLTNEIKKPQRAAKH